MANALTFFRLVLIPVIFYLIIVDSRLAVIVFIVAALTDSFDGWVARATGHVTELGKILDPLTDRLLIIFSIIALYLRDAQPPLWALALMLLRDVILISGYRVLRSRGKTVEVMVIGKVTTAILMVCFILLIMKINVAIWLFYLGFILYLVTGFSYYLQGKKRLETSS